MVTNDANTLALNAVISATLNSISVICLKNALGELFRKVPTAIEQVSSQKKQFTFWLSENEGNGSIVGLSLFGNGATTTLTTGTELVTQAINIAKNNTQSLLIYWTVEVK